MPNHDELKTGPRGRKTRCLGIDLSLNHAAFVLLEDGELCKYIVVTDNPSIFKTDPTCIYMMDAPGDDPTTKQLNRLCFWGKWITRFVMDLEPDYIAIEDYAFAKGFGAHQLGEVGGILRLSLWFLYLPWRKYTPNQIKLYATGKGKATKHQMIKAVKDKWGVSFKHHTTAKSNAGAEEDLCDAYSIAKLLWDEAQVKNGMNVTELHPDAKRVLTMPSKKSGLNLLDSKWILYNG